MELPIADQALRALWSALLGAGLGALYDLNRALRAAAPGRAAAAIADALFACVSAAAAFAFGMAALDGRLRLAALCCALAGWGAYLITLSPLVSKFETQIVKRLVKLLHRLASCLSIIKKIKIFEKKLFSKLRLRFKMVYKPAGVKPGGENGRSARREKRENGHNRPARRGRPHGLRAGGPGRRRGGDREIRHCEGRADPQGSRTYRY